MQDISYETLSLVKSLRIYDKKKLGIRYHINKIIPKYNFVPSSSSNKINENSYEDLRSTIIDNNGFNEIDEDSYENLRIKLVEIYGENKLNDIINREMTRRVRLKFPEIVCKCEKLINFIIDRENRCNICDKIFNSNTKFFGCIKCNLNICAICF